MPLTDTLKRFARVELAAPRYLLPPAAGIDISASGVKLAVVAERLAGLELVAFGEERLELGVVASAEPADRQRVADAVRALAKKHGIRSASIALPESRSYLFETDVPGTGRKEWRTAVEPHIDEFVPLPPQETAFDVASTGETDGRTHVVGVGYASRVIEESLATLDAAGIAVTAIESETFSLPRALLSAHDTDTVLIIDIGRTTTKLMIVEKRLPRFATTLDIGGHALTLAVVKHFGVSEEEAKRVKADKGLVGGAGNEEYLAAMLSTVSAIREEIARRLAYWQARAGEGTGRTPVSRAVLAGGNATVRGLPEYLETSLRIPVVLGDVFANLASRDQWLPPIDYMESLAYATAIGLALRTHDR
ncbi:MAG TPA: pilus assembly protein PilM [Candidatus Paceibacterota bacterium]|nr:pilus assembly protein PilM [Candidatus Paceibacterota bacterium]